jgi:uncharacterized HAD superfamily protein
MKLGIDIDGCLANFTESYANLLISIGGDRLPADWRTNRDFPDIWDWDKKYGYTSEQRNKAWEHIKSTDFWFELQPLPQAPIAIEVLDQLADDHEVYFITHRMGKQAKQQTEDWLFGQGFVTRDATVLIAGDDKTPIVQGLNLDFYIDDKWTTMYKLAAAPIKTKLYMVDYAHNRHTNIVGVKWVPSVVDGLDDFLKNA